MSLDLDAIKARLAAACPGPWKPGKLRRSVDGDCLMLVREDNPYVIAATLIPQYGDNDTATMLLHSRADMDALVAEVERLRALVVSIVENVVEARTEDENHRLQLLDDAGGLESEIRRLQELHAVTREAGVTHAAVSAAANDYIRGNGTFSYLDLVERLRELTLAAAEKIATQRHDDHVMDVQHAHDEGIEEGERRERAAVVAWLRERAAVAKRRDISVAASVLEEESDTIERGEHRTEGEP